MNGYTPEGLSIVFNCLKNVISAYKPKNVRGKLFFFFFLSSFLNRLVDLKYIIGVLCLI
jgi:hypothetical protein